MGRVQTEIQCYCWERFLRVETPNQIVQNKANPENNAKGRFCNASIENKGMKHRNL